MSTNSSKVFYIIGVLTLILISSCTAQDDPAPTPSLSPTAFPPVTAEPSVTPVPSATPSPMPSPMPTDPDPPPDQTVSSLPDPDSYGWSLVAHGLNQPVGLESVADGSGRLYVLEQPGRIRIIQQGEVREEPFLDIRDRVGDSGSEQGLLGLAFHPDYADNGYLFVNYTDNEGKTVVSRFVVSGDRSRVDPETESKVLVFKQPYKNHNGGHLAFGPEGFLWIATGDGGSAGDPQDNAQNRENLLGKLLRIGVDEQPYSIPEDNPFGNEIWAYGLRNPWRFTFDPLTDDLYIADVGQNQWEEVNYLPAGAPGGANFGWDYKEGDHPYEGSPPGDLELVDPVAEYDHSRGCSVSGGAVYRGELADWQGVYIYGDYCSGRVWGLLKLEGGGWANQQLFQTGMRISAISQDREGEVYLLDIAGSVYRLAKE